MMPIAILCNAGKDSTGKDRKITILIDHMGHRIESWDRWPGPKEEGFHWGPILWITPSEYLTQLQITRGEA